MNALEKLIAQNNLDPEAVMWRCRDAGLVSDNAAGPDEVCASDALKAATFLLGAVKRAVAVQPDLFLR
jgi:hypothetical protein